MEWSVRKPDGTYDFVEADAIVTSGGVLKLIKREPATHDEHIGRRNAKVVRAYAQHAWSAVEPLEGP